MNKPNEPVFTHFIHFGMCDQCWQKPSFGFSFLMSPPTSPIGGLNPMKAPLALAHTVSFPFLSYLSFIHSLVRSFVGSFVRSSPHSYPLGYSFICNDLIGIKGARLDSSGTLYTEKRQLTLVP